MLFIAPYLLLDSSPGAKAFPAGGKV